MKKLKFRFIPQKGKNPKIKGIGTLSVDNKEAVFWTGDADANSKIMGVLQKPELMFINAYGIMLKGFEEREVDKTGRRKCVYMEWYCSFILDEEEK